MCLYDSIDEAKKFYYNYKQQPEDDNESRLRTFKSNSDVVDHYKGSLYNDEALVEYKRKQDMIHSRSRNNTELESIVKEKIMGTALLKRSDMSRYCPLMNDIRDQYR